MCCTPPARRTQCGWWCSSARHEAPLSRHRHFLRHSGRRLSLRHLHLVRPAWSYQLNARFEDHAEHEYMTFVAEHPELDWQTIDGAIAASYGPFTTVADVLRQIGHDERDHKLESLASCARLRHAQLTPA